MSVSATRKVSEPTTGAKKTGRVYASEAQHDSFVEAIDASNAVKVKEKSEDEGRKERREAPSQFLDSSDLTTDTAYVSNSIEALEASGVYEEIEQTAKNVLSKVSVYSNNQSIAKNSDISKKYVKHFFETNEMIEEVDELV